MNHNSRLKLLLSALLVLGLSACNADKSTSEEPEQVQITEEVEEVEEVTTTAASTPTSNNGTCTGTFPSYWQDPKFPEMYEGQLVSNQPTPDYSGHVFQLSDAYPSSWEDEIADQPWRDSKFDAMFDPNTDQKTKTALADEYIWLVLKYIQAGNIDSGNIDDDWNVCDNEVRSWYHIPFQTYNVMSGREFTHGLTREAPVSFSVQASDANVNGTMWAVGFFNPTAAYTLGQVWQEDGKAVLPTENVSFEEGAVVGKPLFTTLGSDMLPNLENMPSWQANISNPDFCGCTPSAGEKSCTMAEESQQCSRSLTEWNPVTLLQFDVAIKDSRAPGTQWVFGTFVADGQNKADVENPWNRISPLGLMWGNSTPPEGALASAYPENPKENGFEDMVIFWETVDMLNAFGGSNTPAQLGHLGCNSRLDGPADKAYSSCMSCHGSASVADQNNYVPPIAAQFGSVTSECAMPDPNNPGKWIDASGATANIKAPYNPSTGKNEGPNISFENIDSVYFASTAAATPFNTTVNVVENGSSTPVNIFTGTPSYANGRTEWVSLDYSLQLSISIVQWQQWMAHLADPKPAHLDVHHAKLPRR